MSNDRARNPPVAVSVPPAAVGSVLITLAKSSPAKFCDIPQRAPRVTGLGGQVLGGDHTLWPSWRVR